MELGSANVLSNSRALVTEIEWRKETLLVRGNVNRSPVDYHVLGFLRGKDSSSEDGSHYDFEPIPKKLQKNCRAFIRGSPKFTAGWSSPGDISFAPGYEVVTAPYRGDTRVRAN